MCDSDCPENKQGQDREEELLLLPKKSSPRVGGNKKAPKTATKKGKRQ